MFVGFKEGFMFVSCLKVGDDYCRSMLLVMKELLQS